MENSLSVPFTSAQYTIIQRMIDESIVAAIKRGDDDALATEEYVDDAISNLDDFSGLVNDVRALEDTVEALERKLDDRED